MNVYSVIYLSSQTSFLTVREYKTVIEYEAIAEHEISTDQVTEIEGRSFYLQTIVISEEGNHHYIALIERQKNMLLQFNSDESLKINFNSDVNDWADDWVRIIMQQLSFAQTEDTIIIVFRFWDKKTNTHKDELLLRMLHTVKTVKKFNDQCKLCFKIKIIIWVIVQNKTMKYQINAISKLDKMQSDIYNIICSSKYSTAKSRDIFIFISEKTLTDCLDACRFVSASHKKAITYCHILLYEIGIVQDSSETDKSIWISKMIQSFLYSDSNHNCSTLHQILVITLINDTADELIFKITNMTQANSATKDKIIICLHSLFSEQDIIYKTAKASHKSSSSDDFNKEKLEMLAQFNIFRSIYEIYKNVK